MTIEFDPEITRNPIWLGMLEPADCELRELLGFYGDDVIVRWTWYADADLRPCFRLTGADGQPSVSMRFADLNNPKFVRSTVEQFAEELRELRSGVIPRPSGERGA